MLKLEDKSIILFESKTESFTGSECAVSSKVIEDMIYVSLVSSVIVHEPKRAF